MAHKAEEYTPLWFWAFSDLDDGLGDELPDDIWSAHFEKRIGLNGAQQ